MANGKLTYCCSLCNIGAYLLGDLKIESPLCDYILNRIGDKGKAEAVVIMRSDPITILLCEDDTFIRTCLGDILKISFNASITQCETGHEAIEILNSKKFDIVISDYDMGRNKGTGLDVFHHIRKIGHDSHFYLFTASLSDFVLYTAFPKFKFISKPHYENLKKELETHFHEYKNPDCG